MWSGGEFTNRGEYWNYKIISSGFKILALDIYQQSK